MTSLAQHAAAAHAEAIGRTVRIAVAQARADEAGRDAQALGIRFGRALVRVDDRAVAQAAREPCAFKAD